MSEELKIIMETIGQLGQAGKEAFIWWLIVKYALHYFTVLFFMVMVLIAIRIVVYRIAATTHGNQLGVELCALLDVPDGRHWDSEYRRPQIKAEILERVRAMKRKETQ